MQSMESPNKQHQLPGTKVELKGTNRDALEPTVSIDIRGATLLYDAIRAVVVDALNELIIGGIDINLKDPNPLSGSTSLEIAVASKNDEIMCMPLKARANY